ncbi:MAG: hypothetical protein KGL39_26110 [Patescibacteria group bacterium]|nr:hypothetical protein [Patescibacteria group bacterium]
MNQANLDGFIKLDIWNIKRCERLVSLGLDKDKVVNEILAKALEDYLKPKELEKNKVTGFLSSGHKP